MLKLRIILLLSLLMTNSCSDPLNGTCLGKSSIKHYSIESKVLEILSAQKEEWTDSGLQLAKGQQWRANVYGAISHCSFDKFITLPNSNNSDIITKFDDGSELEVDGSLNDIIYVTVNGGYDIENGYNILSLWDSRTDISDICKDDTNFDKMCLLSEGMGLSMYIGDQEVKNYSNNKFPKIIKDFEYRWEEKLFIFSTKASLGVKKLEDGSPIRVSDMGKIMNLRVAEIDTKDSSGKLGFKYVNYGDYSKNRGFYTLRVMKTVNECYISNGKGLQQNDNIGSVEYIIANDKPSKTIRGDLMSSGSVDTTAYANGKVWVRVIDSGEDYVNNSGFYQINFDKKNFISGSVGKFLNGVIKPVKEKTLEAAQIIYGNFEKDPRFRSIIQLMLVLYIVIYALYYLMGMVQITQKDLVDRVIKIGLVSILITPDSWRFFNDYFLSLFTDGAEDLLLNVTGTSADSESGIFSFVDITLREFFDDTVWGKISGLPLSGLAGIPYLVLIFYALFSYIFVILEAFIGYLMAIITIAFLISLAPFFISLILFERTREYFKGWIRYLVNFALQPVIVFMALSMMNAMVIASFHNLFDFRVCWECVIPIFLNLCPIVESSNLMDFLIDDCVWDLFCIYFYKVEGSVTGKLFIRVFIFLTFVTSLKMILTLAPRITDLLTQVSMGGGTSTTGQRSPTHASVEQAKLVTKDKLKWFVGQDAATSAKRQHVKDQAQYKKEVGEQEKKIKRTSQRNLEQKLSGSKDNSKNDNKNNKKGNKK